MRAFDTWLKYEVLVADHHLLMSSPKAAASASVRCRSGSVP